MYLLKPGIKQDPIRRWSLPDRIFFGHGACHILAGVYLQRYPDWGFKAVWVKPRHELQGNHVFVTDGQIAFDYHGYSVLERLLSHHKKGWQSRFDGWQADIVGVDFSLLDTAQLNSRNMRGPEQYYGNACARAHRYLDRIDHRRVQGRVRLLM